MQMRSRLPFACILGLALLVPAAPAGAASQTVNVQDNFFSPVRVQVDPGDTVTWPNTGGAEHTVTTKRRRAPVAFDSGLKAPGQSFAFTFAAPGRYSYLCTLHFGMVGVVQVGPDNTPPKLSKVKVKRGKKTVRVSFAVPESARVKATFKLGKKTVKTLKTRLLEEDSPASLTYRPKKLKPGRYTVSLVATDDPAGNASKAVRKPFTVPKPKR